MCCAARRVSRSAFRTTRAASRSSTPRATPRTPTTFRRRSVLRLTPRLFNSIPVQDVIHNSELISNANDNPKIISNPYHISSLIIYIIAGDVSATSTVLKSAEESRRLLLTGSNETSSELTTSKFKSLTASATSSTAPDSGTPSGNEPEVTVSPRTTF